MILKQEDHEKGVVVCPRCGDAKLIGGGCSAMKCMKDHGGRGWFYWCAHCGDELPGGAHCNKCPMDFDPDTVRRVRQSRNTKARRNPIELDSDSE